jgi:hypothetical protein
MSRGLLLVWMPLRLDCYAGAEVGAMGFGSDEGRPTKQYDPDREVGRMFAVGCAVLVVVFLVGSALVGWFWLH